MIVDRRYCIRFFDINKNVFWYWAKTFEFIEWVRLDEIWPNWRNLIPIHSVYYVLSWIQCTRHNSFSLVLVFLTPTLYLILFSLTHSCIFTLLFQFFYYYLGFTGVADSLSWTQLRRIFKACSNYSNRLLLLCLWWNFLSFPSVVDVVPFWVKREKAS